MHVRIITATAVYTYTPTDIFGDDRLISGIQFFSLAKQARVSRTDVPNARFARLRVREGCLTSCERRPCGCQAEPAAASARAEIVTADGRERPLRVYPRCTSNMHAGRDFTHLSALHSIVTDFCEVGGPLD